MIEAGDRYGALVAIAEHGWLRSGSSRSRSWLFQCDCGNTKEAIPCIVIAGPIRSCGCRSKKKKNLLGKKFGRLSMIAQAKSRNGHVYWTCQCECGTTKDISGIHLRNGKISSCGCKIGDFHGLSNAPEYNVWHKIIDRCTNPKSKAWNDYGGRGITVCERWKNSFRLFIEDMGRRPSPELTVERVDNDLGYAPDNCKWATRKEQCLNKRNNLLISLNGRTMTLKEWSFETGIERQTISRRLRRGWSAKDALTKEPQMTNTRKKRLSGAAENLYGSTS